MTNSQLESLNKFLTEEVFGECWHETTVYSITGKIYCKKCDTEFPAINIFNVNTDFTTPEGWWKLWNEAKGREDWDRFIEKWLRLNSAIVSVYPEENSLIPYNLIDLQAFPKAYAKWRGRKGE